MSVSPSRIGAPAASEADTLRLWTNEPSCGCAPAKCEFLLLQIGHFKCRGAKNAPHCSAHRQKKIKNRNTFLVAATIARFLCRVVNTHCPLTVHTDLRGAEFDVYCGSTCRTERCNQPKWFPPSQVITPATSPFSHCDFITA